MITTFSYRKKKDVPRCPSCGLSVPTGGDSPLAFRLHVRKGGKNLECLLRTCWCGLDVAIDQSREDCLGFAFACKRCGAYEGELPFEARCTRCYMRDNVGLKDPVALVAGVREAEVFIPPSRQDLIDGLLAGLLRGAPGLTVDDEAA